MTVPVFHPCSTPVPPLCSTQKHAFAATCSSHDPHPHTRSTDTYTSLLCMVEGGTLEQVQKEAVFSCSTPLEQPGTPGTARAAERAPTCGVCGGSGLDISRPLPWGGYESCTRCLIPDGHPPGVHPGWSRHASLDRARRYLASAR